MSRRVVEEWYEELTWKCAYCDAQNKGRFTVCQTCKHHKDGADKESVATGNGPRVKDPELVKQAQEGAHITCTYCARRYRRVLRSCPHCGDDARQRAAREPSSEPPPEPPRRRPSTTQIPPMTLPNPPEEPSLLEFVNERRGRVAGLTLAVAGLGLLVWLLVWAFTPYVVEAQVMRAQWTYESELWERKTYHDTRWDEDVPSGAFDKRCAREQRGTRDCNKYQCGTHRVQVQVGSKDCNCSQSCVDQGNGFAKCSKSCSRCPIYEWRSEPDWCWKKCPVYDDKCSFSYHRWGAIKRASRTGSCSEPAAYPELPKNPDKVQRIEHHDYYEVGFKNSDDTWTLRPDTLGECSRYTLGANWKLRVTRAGTVTPVAPI